LKEKKNVGEFLIEEEKQMEMRLSDISITFQLKRKLIKYLANISEVGGEEGKSAWLCLEGEQ